MYPGGEGDYPERAEAAEGFADRLIGGAGYLLHNLVARGPRDPSLLLDEVHRHMARFSSGPLAPRIPELRYRLRRRRLHAVVIPEALALYAAACASQGDAPASAEVILAARALLQGRVAELPDPGQQRQAAAFAAAVFVLSGIPVHLITATEASARRSAQAMRAPMEVLGLTAGCVDANTEAAARHEAYRADVVCAAYRDIGSDYLRDCVLLGDRRRPLRSVLERIAGNAHDDRLWLRGLRCAVVEDADLVMIDDVRLPLVISTESDQSQERLLYEQAIELARALRVEADFFSGEEAVHLTATGSGRLARLTRPLGGLWDAQHRREELICKALTVLHYLECDRDYRIVNGKMAFIVSDAEKESAPPPADTILQRLIEVKEGLKLAGRRDVLGRISAPRFFKRYLHLCGVCTSARGLEGEFWALYRLKAERAAPAAPPPLFGARLFATAEHMQRALEQAVGNAAGQPLLIFIRTPAAAKALLAWFMAAKLQPAVLRGVDDEQERAALAGLCAPGAITVALSPAERSIALEHPPVLRLIAIELVDSMRHLARLQRAYGACTTDVWLSLEDESVISQLDLAGQAVAAMIDGVQGEFPPGRAMWLVQRILRRMEQAHVGLRSDVAMGDKQMGDLLAYSGSRD